MAKEKQTGRTRREYKRAARKDAQARHHAPPRRKPLTDLPELHPLRPRWDALGLALLFAGALVLYAASTPRTVMLEDDGLFITTAAFAGVAHPPGYPLYIVLRLARLAGPLRQRRLAGPHAERPHGRPRLRLHRPGSRAAPHRQPARRISSPARCFAVSEHFWSQAIIADVYTTNAMPRCS